MLFAYTFWRIFFQYQISCLELSHMQYWHTIIINFLAIHQSVAGFVIINLLASLSQNAFSAPRFIPNEEGESNQNNREIPSYSVYDLMSEIGYCGRWACMSVLLFCARAYMFCKIRPYVQVLTKHPFKLVLMLLSTWNYTLQVLYSGKDTAKSLGPAIRSYTIQLLHLHIHRSNSAVPSKYHSCYHVVSTNLHRWSTCVSTPR